MKRFRKIMVGLFVLAALAAAVFLAGRYGWKALGFRACQGADIVSVAIRENAVEIKGVSPALIPEGFCGYYAQEQEGTLYVGFRFSAVFGVFEPGAFDVIIPVQGEIREVVLKTKTQETAIWTGEEETGENSERDGIYVRLERDDVRSINLKGGSFSKGCENADGSLLKAGEWIYTGDDIAQLAQTEHRSVLFTVGAWAADDTLLAEEAFLYDTAQGKLYVTISGDGVHCATSDAPDAASDVPPVLTLPILDEIDQTVPLGTAGSSLLAVQAAVKLLDWGVNTGLGVDEIAEAASTWLSQQGDALSDFLEKLSLVDAAYQKLQSDDARELLDSAGCADTEIFWTSAPVEPVEAVMQAAGLR